MKLSHTCTLTYEWADRPQSTSKRRQQQQHCLSASGELWVGVGRGEKESEKVRRGVFLGEEEVDLAAPNLTPLFENLSIPFLSSDICQ